MSPTDPSSRLRALVDELEAFRDKCRSFVPPQHIGPLWGVGYVDACLSVAGWLTEFSTKLRAAVTDAEGPPLEDAGLPAGKNPRTLVEVRGNAEAGAAQPQTSVTTALELLQHVGANHAMVNRNGDIECSCGVTFGFAPPVASGPEMTSDAD